MMAMMTTRVAVTMVAVESKWSDSVGRACRRVCAAGLVDLVTLVSGCVGDACLAGRCLGFFQILFCRYSS